MRASAPELDSALPQMCRDGGAVSFALTEPLALPAGADLTITCRAPATDLRLHSAAGSLTIPEDAHLTVRSCRVFTLPSLAAAAEPFAAAELMPGVFGDSSGRITLQHCRVLFPLQVCRC